MHQNPKLDHIIKSTLNLPPLVLSARTPCVENTFYISLLIISLSCSLSRLQPSLPPSLPLLPVPSLPCSPKFIPAFATQPAASAGSSGLTRPPHLESGGIDLALIDFQSYRNVRHEPPHAAACPYRFPTPESTVHCRFSIECVHHRVCRMCSLLNVFCTGVCT